MADDRDDKRKPLRSSAESRAAFLARHKTWADRENEWIETVDRAGKPTGRTHYDQPPPPAKR